MEPENIILLIVVFMFVCVGIFIVYKDYQRDEMCIENGYQTSEIMGIEPGYLKCCRNTYVNHEFVLDGDCTYITYGDK